MSRDKAAPRAGAGPDQTLRLLGEGYDFLPRRGLQRGRRWFEMRLMLRPVVCIAGGDAPEVLYQPDRFTRVGALPPTTLRLLQGVPSVNQLDGDAHRHRKAGFMRLMNSPSITDITHRFTASWRKRMQDGRTVSLLDEAELILTEAALGWVGVLAPDRRTLQRRTREFSAMVGQAGAAGPGLVPAMALRARSEAWAHGLIKRVRTGAATPPPNSPLAQVALWRDNGGDLLPLRTAAIELINLCRPTVAVARYVVFAADAMRRRPEWRERLTSGDQRLLEAFALEVRRVYPFFPAVGGRVLQPFTWQGRSFRQGEWVLADLHGANHDPARWTQPERFDPDRFLGEEDLSPRIAAQGAGDPHLGHRCPGERITIELIKAAAAELSAMRWAAPPQDFSMPLARMPTAPRDGFIIRLGVDHADEAVMFVPRRRLGAAASVGGLLALGAVAVAVLAARRRQ